MLIIHFFCIFSFFFFFVYAALEKFSVIIYYLVTLHKKVPLVNINMIYFMIYWSVDLT